MRAARSPQVTLALRDDNPKAEPSWRRIEAQFQRLKEACRKRKGRATVSAAERTQLFSMKAYTSLDAAARKQHTWIGCVSMLNCTA